MDVAASAIAFYQAAETCIKIANAFIEKVRAYRQAESRIAALVIRLEGIWLKTETQVRALRNARGHHHERLRQFHEECVRRLIAKLCAASAEMDTFIDVPVEGIDLTHMIINQKPRKRLRYSIVEKHLQKTIDGLEAWHAVFDPSWFLLTLQTDSHITSAFVTPNGMAMAQSHQSLSAVTTIRDVIQQSRNNNPVTGTVFRDRDFVASWQDKLAHSNLAVSSLRTDGYRVIIDTTDFPKDIDKEGTMRGVRDLARILFCSHPSTLGLLQCIGVLRQYDLNRNISQYQFVFLQPPGAFTALNSLRAMLLRGPAVTLDAKYSIAKSITRGILAVHSADFVHKSIRPENILVFSNSSDQDTRAYLVGFERTRHAAANTTLTGDMLWERNIYRHPSRQGIRLEQVYIMQHDVYSLGVCLLEIGLWNTLVVPEPYPKPGKLLHIEKQLAMNNPIKAAWEIKSILIHMAKTFLPTLMGTKYTDVVLSCLTCLDSDATNTFASEKDVYDEDGILVGVVFIEQILTKLESLSI